MKTTNHAESPTSDAKTHEDRNVISKARKQNV